MRTREEKLAYGKAWRERNAEYQKSWQSARKAGIKHSLKTTNGGNRKLVVRSRPRFIGPQRRTNRGGGCFPAALVDLLREAQGGACAICLVVLSAAHRAPDSEAADHCHASDTPRGLLCWTCNISLGWYENHQRSRGLLLTPYETYLTNPPVQKYALTYTKCKRHSKRTP